jgi:general secretion pathway protein E
MALQDLLVGLPLVGGLFASTNADAAMVPSRPVTPRSPRPRPAAPTIQAADGDEEANASDPKDQDGQGRELLTNRHGPLELAEDERLLAAYYSDGLFLFAKGEEANPVVKNIYSRVRQSAWKFTKKRAVDIDVLRRIYGIGANRTAATTAVDESAKQQRFIEMIGEAARLNASDMHFETIGDKLLVDFRVDGMLLRQFSMNREDGERFLHAAYNLSDIQDGSYTDREIQNCRIFHEKTPRMKAFKVDALRGAFSPLRHNDRYAVFRLLYTPQNSDQDVDALGYFPEQIALFHRARATPEGIALVTGPTGSGKSTAIMTNLRRLKIENPEKNIIGVEDPVEYPIPGVRQMAVTAVNDAERPKKFALCIRQAMRQDPDCIFIGEIRDLESADLAVKASLSGHQTWSTLHANSAGESLVRLRQMGVEEYLLFNHRVFMLLVGQRLVRKLCTRCKIPLDLHDQGLRHRIDAALMQRILSAADLSNDAIFIPGGTLADGSPCPDCKDMPGFKGREAVAETLRPDDRYMKLMKKEEYEDARRYWINELDGVSLKQAGLRKMRTGLISPAELERALGPIDEDI